MVSTLKLGSDWDLNPARQAEPPNSDIEVFCENKF